MAAGKHAVTDSGHGNDRHRRLGVAFGRGGGSNGGGLRRLSKDEERWHFNRPLKSNGSRLERTCDDQGEAVLIRVDNKSTVLWVMKRRGEEAGGGRGPDENDGSTGGGREILSSSEAHCGKGEQASGRNNSMARTGNVRKFHARIARYPLAGARHRERGPEGIYGDIARGYSFGRLAAWTSQSYSRNWSMSGALREMIGKRMCVDTSLGEEAVQEKLAAFMAYCAHELKNKETRVAGKLVAMSFFHQQYRGLSYL